VYAHLHVHCLCVLHSCTSSVYIAKRVAKLTTMDEQVQAALDALGLNGRVTPQQLGQALQAQRVHVQHAEPCAEKVTQSPARHVHTWIVTNTVSLLFSLAHEYIHIVSCVQSNVLDIADTPSYAHITYRNQLPTCGCYSLLSFSSVCHSIAECLGMNMWACTHKHNAYSEAASRGLVVFAHISKYT